MEKNDTPIRKYPVGIQTFSRIIEENYVYVDKTDLVWKLAHASPFVFLSRPRRFGKSLLSSTLHSYFAGEKALFEGLKIMEMESEWKSYPVLHFDLSLTKNRETPAELKRALCLQMENLQKVYGKNDSEISPGEILKGLIERAYVQTGKKVVVILDEYDAPLLDVLHEEETLPGFRRVLQEFYQPLKALESMIQFCFITGITKFSQLSIFSTINNLRNVSMEPAFSAICGITKKELETVLKPDIQILADANNWTTGETLEKLKLQYDGYHFTEELEDIFNPFSLMNAFASQSLRNYWFTSGTPSFLFQQMRKFNTNLIELEKMEVSASQFDVPTEAMNSALPLLYQSGYLTIKSYDPDSQLYTLDYPNAEVKVGLLKVGGTAQEALDQINTNNYAVPYQGSGLPVVKIGIGFSKEKRTVSEWIIEK